MTQTVMIVAGEASGDLLGADLMRALRQQRPELRFIGAGGPAMEAEGLVPAFPMSDLAVMGLAEVIPHIPKVFARLNELTELAAVANIHGLITIDAQAFSARLAKRIKHRLGVPCIQYVAPKVWAWRPKRVKKLAAFLDHVLAVLPFEPPYFERYGLSCTFVGHPVLQRLQTYVPTDLTPPPNPKLALLPGSRVSEIHRHWPVMVETFKQLQREIPNLQAIIPLPEETTDRLRPLLKLLPPGMQVSMGGDRFAALQTCRAALAKSGTGNLELAVLGVPMVVGYKLNPLTYFLAKWLVHVPYISLVNWVAGRPVVPEFIQDAFQPGKLVPALRPLLTNNDAWQAQAEALASVREDLKNPDPAGQAAQIILNYIK